MSVSEYFADDYAGAREAFIRAADRAGARRASYVTTVEVMAP